MTVSDILLEQQVNTRTNDFLLTAFENFLCFLAPETDIEICIDTERSFFTDSDNLIYNQLSAA